MTPSHGTGENGAARADSSDSDGETVVYDLDPGCTIDDIEADTPYRATVNGVVEYGVFVDLSENVSGLVHTSNLTDSYEVGETLVVELGEVRENGDVSFVEARVDDPAYRQVGAGTSVDAGSLGEHTGERVNVVGRVVQIKQTGGPTIFQVRIEGGVVPCVAFEDAGVRAFPEVELDDIVRATGTLEERDEYTQLEVDRLQRLDGEGRHQAIESLEADETGSEAASVEPLVEWPAFEKLSEDLQMVASRLREAVLNGRPIRIRHHADGDGLCAGVPLQYSLEQFIDETWEDPQSSRHLIKRLPSKAPFYELEDVTRDLNFALESRKRHGQKLPLFLMLDNGSTAEDTPAYRNLAHYDVPILVVDHHHPDPEAVEDLVETHVNPYMYGEDYRITTGMMSVAIARMISPEITDEIRHVPAVAGLADRSEADAMSDYLELAREEGYDTNRLRAVGEALDYATYWLRYSAGREFVNDLLNVNCTDRGRHEQLVDLLSERAERDVETQLDAAMEHVTHERLDNGAHLYRLDVERHAKRFTYPAPGKTTGKIHDRKVEETGDPVITIGFGPDFAVLRSDGVRLDIPEFVSELQEEVPGGGVSGGGHLVVGSIKFVKGMRTRVIDALVEKMAEAEIDEELGSSAVLADED
ncbi:DHH family phosphoesterase [Halovenus marina]|uniref:DHH family phosphoesterase n=1 Tax=Halovenus marina TaxID=3396621 RepID=UPI003F543B1D